MSASYTLTLAAEADLRDIVRYTLAKHGAAQVQAYTAGLNQCASKLAAGQGGFRTLPAVHPNMRLVLCQHHYIFGLTRDNQPMLVIAFLHERMDFIQRLTARLSNGKAATSGLGLAPHQS